MRNLYLGLLLLVCHLTAFSQADNIIIVTTDGVRWQEIFKGMDSTIAGNKQYNQGDSSYIFSKYWDTDEVTRRRKLLPFFWNIVKENGQLYGNRHYGNKVDNANPYWFSYPGYSEIMTGYPDTIINSNDYPPNPNTTVLEFLNRQPGLKGKVAAFCAWNAFDRILNEERSKMPVFSAFDMIGGNNPSPKETMINDLRKDSYKPWHESECLDVFTHYGAMEYLKNKKPKVIYIAYGETDEWAHAGQYRSYLDAIHQVDAWLNQIWDFVQTDPQYKNKTALFITTDHGRGDINKDQWTSHNSKVADSHEIWFAVMGAGVDAKGEIMQTGQLYQKQFAQTFARLIGQTFTADHPIAGEVKILLEK